MKKQTKVGGTSFNTLVLTSMSLLVSAAPAMASGGNGRVNGFVPDIQGGNRAERLADRHANVEQVRNADIRRDARAADDRIAERIADRINARQARDLGRLNSAAIAPVLNNAALTTHVKGQNIGISNSSLGEPSLNRRGFELDLSSDRQTVVLGSRLFGGSESVTINVGGVSKTFTAGMSATAGEYVAIQEVLGGSGQSISLTSAGVANGGNFSLNDAVSRKVSSLVIPEQVSAIGQFDKKTFVINGDLVNQGTIYGYSTRTNRGDISILADDITNTGTGTISTVLPNSMVNGDVESRTNLALTAGNDINNSGTISSSGDLRLTTLNGDVKNNAGATMSAAGNVNVIAGSGQLSNAGSITSGADVNINAPQDVALNINGIGGTIQAAGNINIRDCALAGDVTMTGGDYFSNALNIRTGSGALAGSVGAVTGTLNTSGYAAHFTADTENLLLGDNFQDGDPTFASTGNITITGNVTANEDLTILAGGNITGSGVTISTANSITPSGGIFKPSTNITIIAGANVSTSGTTTTTIPGTPITSGTASVDFSAGSGGNVTLTNVTINSSSNLSFIPPAGDNSYYQENGGNVTIVAYANGATGGSVTTGDITTTSLNGTGGSVNIIAGANPAVAGTTISVGNISTAGGGGAQSSFSAGGDVNIVAAQPRLDSGSVITFLPDGSVASGGHIVPSNITSLTAGIQTGSIITGSGSATSDVAGSVLIRGGSYSNSIGNIDTTARQIGGNVRVEVANAISMSGFDVRTNALGQSGSSGPNGGNIYLSGSQVSVNQLTTGSNLTTVAGGIAVRATSGSIQTGFINAQGSTSGSFGNGDVVMDAATTLTVNSTSASAVLANNVILGSGNGISLANSGGATSKTIDVNGNVFLMTGNSGNSATIALTGGIETTDSTPGFIEIINNAGTTSSVNVTVPGALNASTAALDGEGGAVTVVSSGGISLGNITSTSLVGGQVTPNSRGGSVFISSGGSGTTVISVGTIDTSAKGTAGNIILLSAGASTTANPTNITHGAFTQSGNIAGVNLSASLNGASTTIPSTINITTNLTGPGAINIRPGGYQTQQGTSGSPIDFTINSPDFRFLVPINVGTTGDSMFLGTLTQASTINSFSLVTSGTLNITESLNTSADNGTISIQARGGLIASSGVQIGFGSRNSLVLASMQQGFDVGVMRGSAVNDIVVAGRIDASNAAGAGSSVAFASQIASVYTNDILTYGTGAVGPGSLGGGVTLQALRHVTSGNIDASSYLTGTTFNATGAGDIVMDSSGVILTGNLTNSGNGRVTINSDNDPSNSGSTIRTGNITSLYTASGAISESTVILTSGGPGATVTGSITTASNAGSSGGVTILGGRAGVLTGDIDTSSNGLNAGNVIIRADGDIRVASIDASTSGVAQNGRGGNVEIVTTDVRGISWGSRDINTSAAYTGASSGDGGQVTIAGAYVSGFDILTNALNNGGSGDGGSVTINASQYLFIKDVNTNAMGVTAVGGRGGDVTIAGGSVSNIGLNTRVITTSGVDKGGSVSEYGSGFIVAQSIATNSKVRGGDIKLLGQNFVTTFSIDSSVANAGIVNVEAGSVEIVSSTSVIFINNGINTSAVSTGGDALGGSVGMVAHTGSGLTLYTNGINASAQTSGAGNAVAGDIFASSSEGFNNSVQVYSLNTTATGGTVNRNGNIFLGARNGSASSFAFSTVGSTPAPNQFFNNTPISGSSQTISVKPGNITIRAGVYDTIGTQSNPVNLTLDFGGDSRLLVPLVTNSTSQGEGIYVSGVNANNSTVGGTLAYERNGYDVHLIGYSLNLGSGGVPGNRISGSISANPATSGTAGDIEIFTFNGIDQTSGTISGNSLTLTNLGSTAITAANAITTNVPTLTARTFNVSGIPQGGLKNLYIEAVTTGVVNLIGYNGVSGFLGSTVSITGGANTSFTLANNASLSGSKIELITAGAANGITVLGSISANTDNSSASLQAAVMSVGPAGVVSADKVLIETAAFDNDGLVAATNGTLAIDNSNVLYSPNLAVTGTGRTVSPDTVSISTRGNLDFGGLIQGGVLSLTPGQSLILVATGNITATGSNTNFSIKSAGTAGDAGSVIMAAGVNYSIGGATFNDISLSSNLPSSTGGSIILDGSNTGFIANSIDLSSASGAGGQLTLIAQGPVGTTDRILLPVGGSISTGGLSQNGDVLMYALGPASGTGNAIQAGDINIGGNVATGGVIDIEVGAIDNGSPILLNGPLSDILTIDDSVGNGSVTVGDVQTNSAYAVYLYANDNLVLNFATATLKSTVLELSAKNGNLALPVNTINVTPTADGSGGIIYIAGNNVTWLNQGTTALTLNADANLATAAPGGDVRFVTGSTATLRTGNGAGNVQLSALSNTAGGTAGITTGGTLIVDQSFITIGPLGTNGDGGAILLEAAAIQDIVPVTGVAIDVSGKGSGRGGTVLISQTGTVPMFVDATDSSGHFSVNVSGGASGGNIGNVFIRNGGDLTVDPSGVIRNATGASSGGVQEYIAGGNIGPGKLTINGVLDGSGKGGGVGGDIRLGSNDPVNVMTIGGKTQPLNGIPGYPILTGSVDGSVTIKNFGGDVTALSTPKSGVRSITLATGGTGNVIVPKKFGSSTLDLFFNADGTGNIIGQTSKATVTGNFVQFTAQSGNVGAANAPILITAANVGATGNNVFISSKKDLNLSGISGATTLFDASAANIYTTGTITAPSIKLTAKGNVSRTSSGDSSLSVNTTNLNINASIGNIANQNTAPLALTSDSSKAKSLVVDSEGDINVNSAVGGKKTFVVLSSGGDINVTGSGIVNAGTLQLNADGGIGTSNALDVTATNLSASAGSGVRINDLASSVVLTSVTAANGDVDISTGSSTKSLETAEGALITANNGFITLQNDNASKGTITIGAGSQIATSGIGGGDVSILIGGTTSTAGTAPAGVNFTVDGVPVTAPLPAGTFFFGANGITVTGTSATTPTITMNVLGGKSVIFNTGSQTAKAITVEGGGTVITADPPITSSPGAAQTASSGETFAPQFSMQSSTAAPSVTSSESSTARTIANENVSTNPTIQINDSTLNLTATPLENVGTLPAVSVTQSGSMLSASMNLIPTNSAALVTDASDGGFGGKLLSSMNEAQSRFAAQAQDGWMSETELSSGHVPGIVFCDTDLSIKSDVSTVIDFTKSETAAHKLNKGAVLFAPTVDTNVETPHGNIRIDANSVVFVVSFKDGVAVYDIDDAHKNAVSVTVAEREVKLAPGNHILLTRNSVRTMDDINPAQFIGHRNLKEHNFNGGKMFSSEFSIPNAISAVMPIKQLFASKHPHTKQLANHLMKTVAIHMHLDQSGNEYKQLVRPSTTAYAQN